MLVPGIVSGSFECRKPLVWIWRPKSARFLLLLRSPDCRGDQANPVAMLLAHKTRGLGDVAVVAHHHAAAVGVEPAVVL